MRNLLTIVAIFLFMSQSFAQQSKVAIAIHGGAGTITRDRMTEEREAEYRAKLEEALQAGYSVLENGGTSLDAVVSAIQVMEESPLFNAGKGAVFTNEGKNELDAAIMDGETRKAGAVAGISSIKSPVAAARAVMDNSPHVMMIGRGAEQFASEQGLATVDPSYFYTDRRFEQLERIRSTEKQQLDHDGDRRPGDRRPGDQRPGDQRPGDKSSEDKKQGYLDAKFPDRKFGTVGAVALDQNGNIAAATSTGGMTNKRYGRVGDVPVIGAGTYADNATAAISATGHGEYFIRSVVAYDISALMKYQNKSVKEAANEVVKDKLVEMGGGGGVIAIDHDGNIAMPFNTKGMYRGSIDTEGIVYIGIYEDEQP